MVSMKRILSLIIALSMLFSMTVFAEGTDDSAHELDTWGYDRYIQILSDIGAELPALELTKPVTKGDFIKSLGIFFGHSHLQGKDGNYTEDLNVAYLAGWITEEEKNNFKADEVITLKDAAAFIIDALGYNKQPFYQTDSAKAYASDAVKLGIYDGITTGWENPISAAQMLKMFYNTMEVNVFEYKGKDLYAEGKTMLYEVHNVKILQGIVTANYQSGMTGTPCGEHAVKIEGVEYECLADTDGMVGKYAMCFVRDDVVLHVVESVRKNKIIVIDNEDVENFTNLRKLTYLDENEKEEDIDFDYPPTVFVNGSLKVIASLNELPNLIGENGETEAIDNDGDGLYEVLKITNYITYVVGKINYNKRIITDDQIGKVMEFDIDNYNLKVIKDGAEITFDDIKAKDVIEISADSEYVSAGGERLINFDTCEFMKILVTSKSVGGAVNEISTKYIEIDETEYELSDYFKAAVSSGKFAPVRVGMSGAFYENHAGKIVYVNTAANAFDKYGFLVWGAYDVEFDGIIIKMFTTDQKVELYKLADKVIVDGASKDNSDSFLSIPQLFANVGGQQMIKNQLVIYRLNSDNEIRYIDTEVLGAGEDEETTLRMDLEFYNNSAATSTDKTIVTTGAKYNGPGDVFSMYSSATHGRYSNINIKPTSEYMFKVSGFAGDTTQSDYDTNKNQYRLDAYNNMQVAEPLTSSKNYEVTTAPGEWGTGSDHTFSSGECIKFYNVGDDNSVQYIVFYDLKLSANSVQTVTGSSTVAFYSSGGKAVNKDGIATDFINVYLPGSDEEQRLVCKDETVLANMTTSNMDSGNGILVEGDIIRYTLNNDGEIAALKRDVDFAKMVAEIKSGAEPACFASKDSTGIQTSNSNYDTVIRWLGTNSGTYFTLMAQKSRWSGLTISEAVKKPAYKAAFSTTSNVLIYDTVDESFSTGSISDLFAAMECGENASVLYVRHTVSQPNLILAYNFMPSN